MKPIRTPILGEHLWWRVVSDTWNDRTPIRVEIIEIGTIAAHGRILQTPEAFQHSESYQAGTVLFGLEFSDLHTDEEIAEWILSGGAESND